MATYQPYQEYSAVNGGGFENSESRPTTGDSTGGRTTTLTPVTIKKILESTQDVQDGPFVHHGQELHHVCFVGVIRNITDHTSNIFITVEDGTGQIEVRKWSEDTNDMSASQEGNKEFSSQIAQQYKIGTYVKVFGSLKEFGGKKNIQYAVIKTVDTFNDVIAHHLEVIKWHAIATGKLPDPSSQGQLNNDGGQSLFVKDNEDSNNTNSTNSSGSPLQKVLEFCKKQCTGKDPNEFAVPVPLVAQSLGLSEEVASNCLSTLMEQGFIYPTFDDNHYFAV